MAKGATPGGGPHNKPQPRAPKLVAAGYWVVVRRGRPNVKTLLELTFEGRSRFTIIEDRRVGAGAGPFKRDRRKGAEMLRREDFFIAARQDLC